MSWHILQLLVVRSRRDTPIASSVWWEVKSNTEYNLARYLYRFWTGMSFGYPASLASRSRLATSFLYSGQHMLWLSRDKA